MSTDTRTHDEKTAYQVLRTLQNNTGARRVTLVIPEPGSTLTAPRIIVPVSRGDSGFVVISLDETHVKNMRRGTYDLEALAPPKASARTAFIDGIAYEIDIKGGTVKRAEQQPDPA